MAGYKSDFGSNIDYAHQRGVRDIASSLQSGVKNAGSGLGGVGAWAGELRNAQKNVTELSSKMKELEGDLAATNKATDPEKWKRLSREIANVGKATESASKKMTQMPLDAMEKGLKGIVGGLVTMNSSILGMGFDFLVSSIKRVYELQERWTKAIGGFNMKIGGTTAGLGKMTKAAVQLSGQLRGLTDGDISEAIDGFAEFNDALGSTTDKAVEFAKTSLELSRGFNLGWSGAGKLTKVMSSMDDGVDDVNSTMKSLVAASNAAGVSTNMVAKDVTEAGSYMTRFGKTNQKTFVEGAAYARKYGMSISDVQKSVEDFDMFDQAAKTASKLNTSFGTMINSMDLMLEDDPAKRFEMIRKAMIDQGLTYDKLSPKQVRLFAMTTHMSEENAAAALKARDAGESYSDFQAKAAIKEKNELDAKKLMQVQLQKTAQTMFAFGVAFDRITVAIANAIQPLLKVFGLASDGDKKFTSFGAVMESVTKTVEEFFNSLAKDPQWNDFMGTLADDLVKAGHALKEFVMSGKAAALMGDIASGMKSFYITVRDLATKAVPLLHPLMDAFLFLSKHIKELTIAWAGMKAINFASKVGGMFGGGGSSGGKGNGGGKGMALGALGVGAAGLIGGQSAGIGAGIGAMVLGPIIGPIVGGLAGKAVEMIMAGSKSDVEKAHDDLDAVIERETTTRKGLEGILEIASDHQKADDRIRHARNEILESMDKDATDQKSKTIVLNSEEADMLRRRADELMMFGKSTKITYGLIANLGEGSKLTKEQLDAIVAGSQAYETELDKLRATTQKQADLQMAQLQTSKLGLEKDSLESQAKLHKSELDTAKQQLKDMGGSAVLGIGSDMKGSFKDRALGSFTGSSGDAGMMQAAKAGPGGLLEMAAKGQIKITEEQRKRLEQEDKVNKLSIQTDKEQGELMKKQTDFLRQSVIIQLRASLMQNSAYLDFTKSTAEAGKTGNQIYADFLNTDDAKTQLGGQGGVDLLKQGSDYSSFNAKAKIDSASNSPNSSPMQNYATKTIETGNSSQVVKVELSVKNGEDLLNGFSAAIVRKGT